MVRDPYAEDPPPDIEEVLAILADKDAQTIIRTLEEPMTAQELHEQCDIPESTLYRKLDRLTDTGLLHQQTRIRRDGRHTSEYVTAFTDITISRSENSGDLQLEITAPAKPPDERLAELWTEVSKEV